MLSKGNNKQNEKIAHRWGENISSNVTRGSPSPEDMCVSMYTHMTSQQGCKICAQSSLAVFPSVCLYF